jgi:rhodanese-related sulfurtransferase
MKKSILFVTLMYVMACRGVSQDNISTADFSQRMQTAGVQLLDVRTAGEYKNGHLKNSLQADWTNTAQFTDRVQYLDKNKPVLVYCASGGRSAAAAKYLKEKGFTSVVNLQGGITAWKMEGRPLEAAATNAQMSAAQYKSLTVSSSVVLVDFGAEWCPPCKKMEPVLQQLQKDMPAAYKLVKVDGGQDIDVMKSQNVEALPVFIVYKQGKEVWRKQGVVELNELKAALTK